MNFKFIKISNNIVRIIFMLIAIYIIFNIVKSIFSNYKVNDLINQGKKQITELESANRIIENQNIYYQTDTYRELEARKKMGLKKSGEIMVIAPENNDNRLSESSNYQSNNSMENLSTTANYEKWLKYLFD